MVSFAPKSIKFLRYSSPVLFSKRQNAFGWTSKQHIHVPLTVEFSEYTYDDDIPDDSKMTEKDTALKLALSKLSGDFGKESMLSLQGFYGARRAPVISTGSIILDQALRIGGVCQREGWLKYKGKKLQERRYLHSMLSRRLKSLEPDSAENLPSMLAALIPQCEVDSLSFVPYEDLQSKIMTQALQKILHASLCSSDTLVVFINLVRKKLRLVEGSVLADEVTSGRNALGFRVAIRLRISRKGLLKKGRKICCESKTFDLACEHGVMQKERSDYYIHGKVLQSREEALRHLAAKDGAFDDIIKTLRFHLFKNRLV